MKGQKIARLIIVLLVGVGLLLTLGLGYNVYSLRTKAKQLALKVLGIEVSIKARVIKPPTPTAEPPVAETPTPETPQAATATPLVTETPQPTPTLQAIVLLNNLSDKRVQELTGLSKEEFTGRQPRLSASLLDTILGQLTFEQLISAPRYQVTSRQGTVRMRLPGSDQLIDFQANDPTPLDTTIFTETDGKLLVTIPEVGIFDMMPFSQLEFPSEGIEQAMAERQVVRKVSLLVGDTELLVAKGPYDATFGAQTLNTVINVEGTHFWITYNQERNYTAVGVFEGRVSVSDNLTGEIVSLIPQGDKPGVALIFNEPPAGKDLIPPPVVALLKFPTLQILAITVISLAIIISQIRLKRPKIRKRLKRIFKR